MNIIILLIGLLLDGILSLYISNSSYLIPLITIVNIFLIYNFLKKKEKTYFLLIGITGFIYDLLYTNLLFFHLIIFIILGFITKYIYKNFTLTPLRLIIFITIIISLYEVIVFLTLSLFRIIPLELSKLTYKITHSIIINVIYAEILYLISTLKIKKT